jgi:hypothetical protein
MRGNRGTVPGKPSPAAHRPVTRPADGVEMDDRQVRLIVVLSAAVLAAGVLFWLVPRGEDPPWREDATHTVWELDPDRVERLRVEQPDEPALEVVRTEDDWQMLSPEAQPADILRVEAALDTLADIELGVPLPESDPAELGLGEPPVATVTLTLEGGQTRTLQVGEPAPVGWQTYVRAPDGTVVSIPLHLERDLLGDPLRFRDAALLRFPLARVVGGELHSPHGTLVLDRDQASDWWLEGWGRADPAAVDNFFLTLRELRFDRFLDGAAPGGIAEPEHRAVVVLDDGTALEARFGEVLPLGGGAARLAEAASGTQGAIDRARLAFLDQGPTDLGDRLAFPVRGERVDRIAFRLGEDAVVLEGPEGRRRSADHGPAATQALDEAIRRAARATADVPEAPEALSSVEGQVRITEDDRLMILDLGPVEGPIRWVRDQAGGPIYAVREDDVQRIVTRIRGG